MKERNRKVRREKNGAASSFMGNAKIPPGNTEFGRSQPMTAIWELGVKLETTKSVGQPETVWRVTTNSDV